MLREPIMYEARMLLPINGREDFRKCLRFSSVSTPSGRLGLTTTDTNKYYKSPRLKATSLVSCSPPCSY